MRPPSRQRPHGLRFNVTPLIDVVFLLIIFFLAAGQFARNEDVIPEEIDPVRLDDADRDEGDSGSKRLVVTITSTGTVYVRGEAVPSERAEFLVRNGSKEFGDDFEVRLRTDRRTPFGFVEPLLLTCARSGVSDLKFTVRDSND